MHSLCPHSDPFTVGGIRVNSQEIIDVLGPFIQPERRDRIRSVVASRTYAVVPALEGVCDRGNVSAVLRTAEALGFQAVHIVESSEKFKEANRVTQGAENWLDVSTWESTRACCAHLQNMGYRIVAAHVSDARPISEISFDIPTAVFFGNEKDGLSQDLLSCADERVVVPMPGFTRSFNISVAAALSLYHIYLERTARAGGPGDLSESEQLYLTASYYLRSVDYAAELLARNEAGNAE